MNFNHLQEIYLILGGYYLAFGSLHFVLYLYNKDKKANLIYALALMLVFFNFTIIEVPSDAIYASTSIKAGIIINLATNGALLYFVSYYYNFLTSTQSGSGLKIFFWSYFAGILYLLFTPDFSTSLTGIIILILRIACYIFALSICVNGIIKKIPDFHLIVVATFLLILTEAFIAVDLFSLWHGESYLRSFLLIIGYSFPFLFYSTYLSKELAVTGKKLSLELMANARLSKEKYQQELITRELLEKQNIELEKNVQERTREISLQKEEIEKQSKKIEELDEAKSRFFANISHEFRTPLTLILGPIEKRLAQATTEEDQQELMLMHQNATRLLNLVNQLLDLSRLEAKTLKIRAIKSDLGSFIAHITSQFTFLATSKDIKFTIERKDDIQLYFDRDKLEKVLTNLLSNAFKFTPPKGKITVILCKGNPEKQFPHGYAEIKIVDTGIGISDQHIDKIFERFYQVDNTITREYEGSGIGLALAKELVELHGGSISVVGAPEEGTCFVIRMPLEGFHLKPEDMAEQVIPEISFLYGHDDLKMLHRYDLPPEELHSLPKLLIVEDNADLRFYIRDNLKHQFSFLEAGNGEDGLNIALDQIPDLIISDLIMPKMSGFDLCQQIKSDERTSHIPFILLTARADKDTVIESLQTGVDCFIPKPFEIQELTARIFNLIETRKKLQNKFSQQLNLKPKDIKVISMDHRFLQKVMEIVEKHIDNPAFNVEILASEAAMSTMQIYRKLKALTGHPPNDLIRTIRLDRAASLLKQHASQVAEIAYQVGFNNLSYFSKCFKEKFGTTPSDFMKQDGSFQPLT